MVIVSPDHIISISTYAVTSDLPIECIVYSPCGTSRLSTVAVLHRSSPSVTRHSSQICGDPLAFRLAQFACTGHTPRHKQYLVYRLPHLSQAIRTVPHPPAHMPTTVLYMCGPHGSGGEAGGEHGAGGNAWDLPFGR